jgi:hypothetical protein
MPRERLRVCLQDGLKLDLNRLIRRGFVRLGECTGPIPIQWLNSDTGEVRAVRRRDGYIPSTGKLPFGCQNADILPAPGTQAAQQAVAQAQVDFQANPSKATEVMRTRLPEVSKIAARYGMPLVVAAMMLAKAGAPRQMAGGGRPLGGEPKSGDKPDNIPAHPWHVYAGKSGNDGRELLALCHHAIRLHPPGHAICGSWLAHCR